MLFNNYELFALDNNRDTFIWITEVELIWCQMHETLHMFISPLTYPNIT
jgi:hypothetical protein